MKTLHISAIQISPDRQRKTFDEAYINELKESIEKQGLFHAVVLRQGLIDNEKGLKQDSLILVSGECRLRAATDLYSLGGHFKYDDTEVPVDEIPYVMLGDLSELQREEAEFDENSKRRNLSWQEEADAVRRLAAARARAAGLSPTDGAVVREVARTAIPAAAELPTGALGIHQETTRRQIIVAAHLEDPEVKAAKSVDEAFKILRRKEDTAKRVQLAAEVGRTYSSDVHTALNVEAILYMTQIPDETYDVICTDPPYGINADQFGDSGGHAAGAHFYKDDYETWKKLIQALARESFRLTKPQAHMYAFCDITRFEEFKGLLTVAGWECFRTPIIWHKPNGSRLPWVDRGPQRKWEIILYANKGKKPVTRIYPDLVSYTADENLGHQAQKPVALYEDLLRRSCGAGDKVLDPFCGSGPLFPAAQALKLRATGLEQDPAAYAIALKRIQGLKEAPELAGL